MDQFRGASVMVGAVLALLTIGSWLADASPGAEPAGAWVRTGTLLDPGPLLPASIAGQPPIAPEAGRRDDFWVVRTFESPQVKDSDPWPGGPHLGIAIDQDMLPHVETFPSNPIKP